MEGNPPGMADVRIVISYEGVPGDIAWIGGIGVSPPGEGWIPAEQCSFWTADLHAVSPGDQARLQTEIKVSFVTQVNMATNGLLRAGLTGSFDKSAVIAFLRTAPDGTYEEYIRLELENCGLSEVMIESHADRPHVHGVLSCGQITIMSWSFDGSTRGAAARVTILNEV